MAKLQGLRSQIQLLLFLCVLCMNAPTAYSRPQDESAIPEQDLITRVCRSFIDWLATRKQSKIQAKFDLAHQRLSAYMREHAVSAGRVELQRTSYWMDLLDQALKAQIPLEVLAPHPRTGNISSHVLSLSEMRTIREQLDLDPQNPQTFWRIPYYQHIQLSVPLAFVFLPDTLTEDKKKEVEEVFELDARVRDFYLRLTGSLEDLRLTLPKSMGGFRETERNYSDFSTGSYAANLVRIQELSIHHKPQAWEDLVHFLTEYIRDHFKNQVSEIEVRPMLDKLALVDHRFSPEVVFEDSPSQDGIFPHTPIASNPILSHDSPTTDLDPWESFPQAEKTRSPLLKSEMIQRFLPLFSLTSFRGVMAKARALNALNEVVGTGSQKVTPRDLKALRENSPELYAHFKAQIILIMEESHAPNIFNHGAPHAAAFKTFLKQAELDLGDDWKSESLFVR